MLLEVELEKVQASTEGFVWSGLSRAVEEFRHQPTSGDVPHGANL